MRNIRAIRNEADYDWALVEIARYFENQPSPGTEAADRFDVLASLVEAYEAKYWPIESTDPIEAIEYRMEISGYTQKDLGALIGSRSRASELLKRKRPLTMKMAHKLSVEWDIPAEVLLKPYHLDSR